MCAALHTCPGFSTLHKRYLHNCLYKCSVRLDDHCTWLNQVGLRLKFHEALWPGRTYRAICTAHYYCLFCLLRHLRRLALVQHVVRQLAANKLSLPCTDMNSQTTKKIHHNSDNQRECTHTTTLPKTSTTNKNSKTRSTK